MTSEQGLQSGQHTADQPTRVELVFDNSFSWLREKDVRYRLYVLPDKVGADGAGERDQGRVSGATAESKDAAPGPASDG